jgi:hypothetical protein
MFLRPAFFLAALAALAGCTSVMSPVVPTGEPDQYTVTNRVTGRMTTWVELKSEALKRAGDFCVSQNQKMVKPTVSSNHATGFTPQEAYVTFSCQTPPAPSAKEGAKDSDKDQEQK